LYAAKYRQKNPALRTRLYRQLHQQLHHELNLAPYLDLDTSLRGALFKPLFETFFQQLFATLLGSLFDQMFVQLWASTCHALCRQMLLPRRPVDRGVGGRIVVRNDRTTTYRRRHATMATRVASIRQAAESYEFVGIEAGPKKSASNRRTIG
jgi:hypothetical protein